MTIELAVHSSRFAAALAGIAAAVLSACSSVPTTGKSPAANAPMAYAKAGTGSPAVVLQSGLGDGKEAWSRVFDGLATHSTVVAYDRPGYGGSPLKAGPRDPCTVAREQRELLMSIGVMPPYILVGHSLGGLYEYVYARLYPDDVAGLVLLDATHPQQWERMQADTPTRAAVLKGLRLAAFTGAMGPEFDDQAACLDRLAPTQPLKAPTRLMVRTDFPVAERGEFQAMTVRLADDWRRLTGASAVEPVQGAGHYIQKDRPDTVVGVVRELVEQSRRKR
jgi:pimeloyl-ACP methyl ester carboxylesterase